MAFSICRKSKSGKLQLINERFDLHDTIEETIELFASAARSKELNLACRISDDLPQQVFGDAGRLRQILTNLIGNAIKFTEAGEVVLTVRSAGSAGEHFAAEFEVRDTGVGIPVEKQREIFDPFSQVDGSSSRRYGGTGLGLSIARQLCELMGGSICLESQSGQGSVFRFTVMLTVARPDSDIQIGGSRPLDGLSVLVVDDNATNLEILQSQLARMGMKAHLARNAPAALNALRECKENGESFDFVLIDRLLQHANGCMLARQMREQFSLSSTYFIVLSSLEEIDRDEEAKFDGWLVKPVRQAELRQCLVSLRTRKALQRAPRQPVAARLNAAFAGTSALLVEDNEINMEVARAALLKEGCVVTTAKNGKEALVALDGHYFDIIFMDCQMPEMDGFEATTAIRSLPFERARRTPIIALTANAIEGDREVCLRAGMDDYLAKPFGREAVRAMLTRWCVSSGSRGDDTSSSPVVTFVASDDELCVEALERLRDLQGDDSADFLQMVMSRFLDNSSDIAAQLIDAAKSGDTSALRRVSHMLKSSSSIIGATALAESCGKVEVAIREDRIDEAVAFVDQVLARLERVRPAIRAHIDENSALATTMESVR